MFNFLLCKNKNIVIKVIIFDLNNFEIGVFVFSIVSGKIVFVLYEIKVRGRFIDNGSKIIK